MPLKSFREVFEFQMHSNFEKLGKIFCWFEYKQWLSTFVASRCVFSFACVTLKAAMLWQAK